MKNKTLKKWNGRGQGNTLRGTFYVAAYTQKQAAGLIAKAGGYNEGTYLMSEIRNYYHAGSWGNSMDGIEPTEPCVYFQKQYETPIRIL